MTLSTFFEFSRQTTISIFADSLGRWFDDQYHLPTYDAKGCGLIFGAFFVFWCALGLTSYRAFAKRKGDEYASRVVSGLHTIVSVSLCLAASMDGISLDPDWGRYQATATGWHQVACLCSAAYFTMDMIGILVSTYFSWLFVGHHLVSFAALLGVAVTQSFGFALVLTMFLVETTNIPLHARWLLIEEHNMQYKKKAKDVPWSTTLTAVSCVFYVTFFAVRVLIGPFLTMSLLLAYPPWWLSIVASLVQIFSIEFFVVRMRKGWRGELWQ